MNVYHMGTMEERNISEVAYAVAACYGREIKVIPGKLPQGSPPRRLPDTEKIKNLGNYYYPEVPFPEGLAKTVEWYRANG
jgi:nucleoside-diphosphate-sugar epimerase